MDEPTQALSQVERKNLFAIIRKLKGQGVSIIYISHYLEEIFEMADSVTVLRDGLSISTKSVQDVSPREIVTLMIGKKVDGEHHKERKDETRGEERFSVKGVTRRGVLHDIGLSLKQGEILGLVGSIGAGKTELARILFGLDPMDLSLIHI